MEGETRLFRTASCQRQPIFPRSIAGEPEAKTCRDQEMAFFNGHADKHGDFNPFCDRGWRTLARRFEELVRPSRPIVLLDVGCGTGRSRQLYMRHAAHYVGVDLAASAIAIARRRFPESDWRAADACALPFPDDFFDVVAYSSVLHHMPDYAEALVEGRRVVKSGGTIFAFDPNLYHPAMALFRHPRSPFYLRKGVSPNERPLRPAALRKAFAQAGLESLQQRCQSDIPYRQVAPRFLNALLGMYNCCDWAMERIGLGRWLGTFVITCGRKPADMKGVLRRQPASAPRAA